jgi:FMN phosphatase YigB (HAD superfamily)
LFVVDVGRTVGVFTGPRTVDVLGPVSRAPTQRIREESRRVLHRSPEVTEEVIADLCGALLIDPKSWPDPWPVSGFEPFAGAAAVLAELAAIAPVVALTNLPCASGPRRVWELLQVLGGHVSAVYTSYELGCRKPDPALWRWIAREHAVPECDVVHIGDHWFDDVEGAIAAGCNAVQVVCGDSQPPARTEWPAGSSRLATVNTIGDVPMAVKQWIGRLSPRCEQPTYVGEAALAYIAALRQRRDRPMHELTQRDWDDGAPIAATDYMRMSRRCQEFVQGAPAAAHWLPPRTLGYHLAMAQRGGAGFTVLLDDRVAARPEVFEPVVPDRSPVQALQAWHRNQAVAALAAAVSRSEVAAGA